MSSHPNTAMHKSRVYAMTNN